MIKTHPINQLCVQVVVVISSMRPPAPSIAITRYITKSERSALQCWVTSLTDWMAACWLSGLVQFDGQECYVACDKISTSCIVMNVIDPQPLVLPLAAALNNPTRCCRESVGSVVTHSNISKGIDCQVTTCSCAFNQSRSNYVCPLKMHIILPR